MRDKNKSWEDLLASGTLSRKEVIEALTEALALVHTLKQGAPNAEARPLVSDMLFDLASFQTETVKRLAELSARHTGAMVHALKERRATARSAGGSPVRVLVSPSIARGDELRASFVIRNDASVARGYPLPDVVHLERIDGADGVFVRSRFLDGKGASLEAPSSCAQPFFVHVQPKSPCDVTLVIPWDDRLEPGRYRGVVPLEAEGAPSAELIIELRIKEKSA